MDHHHHPDDPRLCLRLYVGGHLADEQWIDVSEDDADELADAAGAMHAAACEEANERGLPWLIEVYDPAAPPSSAYLRFGTDPDGMVQPAAVDHLLW